MKPLSLFALSIASLAAQPLAYTLLQSSDPKPTPRVDGTIAYEPAGRRIFLFGGRDNASLNDLWSYSLDQRRWQVVTVGGAKPPARFGHTLLHDPVRNRLILFAGQDRGFFSDVWAFDIAQGSWRQLAADEAGPSRRYGHSAIYDAARDRMVISHGFTNSGRFDDTWAFNFSNDRWQNISPSGTRPLRRCLHHAVYDPANNQMLLYGGCASGFGPCPLADLWSYDLVNQRWTEITGSNKPPAREHYGTAFDTVRARMVVYGGIGNGALDDTWGFDVQTKTWTKLDVQGNPGARSRHQGIFASDRGNVFFFGGSTNTGLSNDLWMLGPGFVTPKPEIARGGVANAFSGAGNAAAPGEIVSIYGSNLGPIEGISFGFDPLTGKLPVSGPGMSVTINGIAVPLYYARADQINMQVPYEVAGASELRIIVTVTGQASDPFTLPLAAEHPGVFPKFWNQDGSVNSAENPARRGTVIVMFATGQGITNPASTTGAPPAGDRYPAPATPVTLRIGNAEAEILFAGQAPGTVGAMQVNARVPESASGAVPVTLKIGAGEASAGTPAYVQ